MAKTSHTVPFAFTVGYAYNTDMKQHKLLTGVCASLLALSLFGIGLFGSIYKVVSTPEPLKHALKESGIYETGINDALEKAQKDQQSGSKEDIPTSDPAIRDIIKSSFPPEYLQGQAEHALDSMYAWLHGDTPKLAFSLDVEQAKTKLADGLGTYAQNRLDTLPVCTAADQIPSGDVDVFNAACVPPGFNKAEAVAKTKDEILNGDFLKDSHFDADEVKNDNGQTLKQQLQAVPNYYQMLMLIMYMLGGMAVVMTAGIVWLSGNWRRGLRLAGFVFVGAGIFTTGLGIVSSIVMHKAVDEFSKSGSNTEPLQQKVVKVVQLLTDDVRGWLLTYGIVLLVIGVGAIVAWFILNRSQRDPKLVAERLAAEPDADVAAGGIRAGREGSKPKLPKLKD